MEINPVEMTTANGTVRVESSIVSGAGSRTLWFDLDTVHERYIVTDRLDAFLVGSMLLAMQEGEDLVVKGAVSEKLLYNLRNYYVPMLVLQIPALKPIRIFADAAPPALIARGVATGFSAGVDSFCALYDHFFADVPSSFKLTHLVFNNVGSHGYKEHGRARRLFRARYALVRGYAGEIGLDLIGIDSNVSELLMMNFQQTHVPRNVAPALLLQRLLGKYYYASGYRYQDAFIGATHDLAYSDAASVHLLSTETLDCISSGSQYSRVEKTARVAAIPGAERWLNVCVRSDGDGTNCSTCWKCCRTLFTLEVLGELARFAQAFDLESWARVRSGYIRSTILGDVGDPFVREIREHCDKVGYRFPRRDILAAKVLRLRRMLPRS
jgi:hypothetical protein